MTPKPYDATVAMIAGNIAASLTPRIALLSCSDDDRGLVRTAVRVARAIVAEVQRTEPEKASDAMTMTSYPAPLPLEQEIRDALTTKVLREVGQWWEKKHAAAEGKGTAWQREATIQIRGMLLAAIRPVLAQAAAIGKE